MERERERKREKEREIDLFGLGPYYAVIIF